MNEETWMTALFMMSIVPIIFGNVIPVFLLTIGIAAYYIYKENLDSSDKFAIGMILKIIVASPILVFFNGFYILHYLREWLLGYAPDRTDWLNYIKFNWLGSQRRTETWSSWRSRKGVFNHEN